MKPSVCFIAVASLLAASCSKFIDSAQFDKNIKVREDVPLNAFYKDIFLDGGIHASAMSSMPAAEMLDFSQDCLLISPVDGEYCRDDTLAQDRAFIGCAEDLNGYLLYPDGAPRYSIVFVNGGNATSHGRSMKEEGRANFRKFVKNGGGYIGSCSGAFVAAKGSDSVERNENYIGLWPSNATNCHLSDARTGLFVDKDSPLLKYYDFGGDNYVADVYHNGGCCLDEKYRISGTETLTRYDYNIDPEKHNYMHEKPASWAYKADSRSGRVIMSGSHPENVKSGERRDLMASYLRYAKDGQGITTVKCILHNGETVTMDKSTADGDPAHTRIGDKQCHHFVMWIPEGAKNVKVTLRPKEKFKFRLMLARENFAYTRFAEHRVECEGGNAAVASFKSLPAGQWYVCVQCMSVPTSEVQKYGTVYTDTAILNGAAYDLTLDFRI